MTILEFKFSTSFYLLENFLYNNMINAGKKEQEENQLLDIPTVSDTLNFSKTEKFRIDEVVPSRL